MTLADLASVGSFISGIAVVVTLIFLLVQTRQTERNQRALMQQMRSARLVDTLLKASEPHLCEAMGRAFANDATMDDAKFRSFLMFTLASLTNWEDTFLQYRAGALDEKSFVSDTAILRLWASLPAFRAVWYMMRETYTGDYRAYVEELVRETKVLRTALSTESAWKTLLARELESGV